MQQPHVVVDVSHCALCSDISEQRGKLRLQTLLHNVVQKICNFLGKGCCKMQILASSMPSFHKIYKKLSGVEVKFVYSLSVLEKHIEY